MGDRESVALLKELYTFKWSAGSINIAPLRGSSRPTPSGIYPESYVRRMEMNRMRALKHLAILWLLFAPGTALAQRTANPWLTEVERAKFETLRVSGSEALFNLDYETARKQFKEMAVAISNYPAGPQFLADTLWAETLYQTRRLQSSLYGSDDTFYSTSDDKADPRIVDQFRTLTRQARLLTEARLKQFPKDPEALYFMGAIAGLKASFEEAVDRRHFAALKDGSDAVDKHREVIKLDPSYRDAELTIGLYDYT